MHAALPGGLSHFLSGATVAVGNAPPGQTLAIADEKEMVLGSRKRDVGTPQAAEHRATHCSTLLRTKACTRTYLSTKPSRSLRHVERRMTSRSAP